MKITKYTYSNTPSLLPLSEEPYWDKHDIEKAGFDSDDEDIMCCTLSEDWNGHKAGSTVVTGQTTEGAPFVVIEVE